MFMRILVPLDGSELAERALLQATTLCPEAGEIVLLQVFRLPLPVMTPDVGMTMPMTDMDDMLDEATSYLNKWVDQLQIRVSKQVQSLSKAITSPLPSPPMPKNTTLP